MIILVTILGLISPAFTLGCVLIHYNHLIPGIILIVSSFIDAIFSKKE